MDAIFCVCLFNILYVLCSHCWNKCVSLFMEMFVVLLSAQNAYEKWALNLCMCVYIHMYGGMVYVSVSFLWNRINQCVWKSKALWAFEYRSIINIARHFRSMFISVNYLVMLRRLVFLHQGGGKWLNIRIKISCFECWLPINKRSAIISLAHWMTWYIDVYT